jgi:hypothetical protein
VFRGDDLRDVESAEDLLARVAVSFSAAGFI